jgi:hypothetical protein
MDKLKLFEKNHNIYDMFLSELKNILYNNKKLSEESISIIKNIIQDKIKNSLIKKENPLIKKENPLIKKENPLIKKENPLIKKENPLIKKENPLIKKENHLIKKENPIITDSESSI